MKIFFRNIHLYLSLAAGLVIMTCCFTGAILVFEKELQEMYNHHRYYVKQQPTRLPIEHLISNVKEKYPAAKIASVKLYPNPERSVEVGITMGGKANESNASEGSTEKKSSTFQQTENNKQDHKQVRQVAVEDQRTPYL